MLAVATLKQLGKEMNRQMEGEGSVESIRSSAYKLSAHRHTSFQLSFIIWLHLFLPFENHKFLYIKLRMNRAIL